MTDWYDVSGQELKVDDEAFAFNSRGRCPGTDIMLMMILKDDNSLS